MSIDLNEISGTRLIHTKEILEIFGFKATKWWGLVKDGVVSKGVEVGYKRKAWPAEEIRNLYNKAISGEVKLWIKKPPSPAVESSSACQNATSATSAKNA